MRATIKAGWTEAFPGSVTRRRMGQPQDAGASRLSDSPGRAAKTAALAGGWLAAPSAARRLRCLEAGVRLGDTEAMLTLAEHYAAKPDDKARLRRAQSLYERAFRRGETTAAYNLASTLMRAGNYRAAVRWYERALSAGDRTALFPLGKAHIYGVGVRRNVPAGLAMLRRLAASRDVYVPSKWLQCEAMVLLGTLFIDGWLVKKDRRRGMEWIRRAARLGSPVAVALVEYGP